jgi:hypothetical protein
MDDGTLHQELRDTLQLLLPRFEQLSGDHATEKEMSGLQELEKKRKRTLMP